MGRTLEGKVVLITGAGNGIGKATAIEMASRGAIVGVNDLKAEFVDAVVAQITAQGGRAVPLVQNIASREGVREAVFSLKDKAGGFHVMVNNAAWVRYQAVAEIQPETMDRMLEIGFKTVVWGIQAAAEAMGETGGSIINIASTAGFRSAKSSIVYSGIKAGIMGITRAAAAELGAQQIRVNAIAPSAIPTEGTAKHRTAEKDAKRIASTPLGRLGTVQDIALAVCFLAGDDAGFVSGEVLTVDGGITNTNL